MTHSNSITTIAGAVLACGLVVAACGTTRKLENIRSNSLTAQLVLANEDQHIDEHPDMPKRQQKDTFMVVDFEGHQTLIMNAIRDEETGETVAHDVLQASYVTARFRNLAERHGKVDIAFQVVVPEALQDSKWQLRFYPDMFVLEDSIRLDPVVITGREYRKAQLKGYQQYQRFLDRIVSDTTRYINWWQLELFLERNLPQIFAFKTDSTEVSDEKFESYFGVSEKEAIDHYTNHIAVKINKRRISRKDKMFAKYVKAPIVTEGLRLDTVIQAVNGDFVYEYVQTINTRPKLRKVDVVLSGEAYEQDRKLYDIPPTDPLTFYISSLSSFVDGTERYLTKVIERRAEANTSCNIVFAVGKDAIDLSLGNNREELTRIKQYLGDLMQNTAFDLDSLVITATASPEGSIASNAKLSQRRGESIGRYFKSYMKEYQDSLDREFGFSVDEGGNIHKRERQRIDFIAHNIPENWDMLDILVDRDSVMTDAQKENYRRLRAGSNLDAAENSMRQQGYYKYMKDNIYPKLRQVKFDFHLHRAGMVKDTVHTTELDSAYMRGVQAIRDRDYEAAAVLLAPYQDFNLAIAYVSLDRNASAMALLQDMEKTAPVNYMLAILYARKGDDRNAVQCYIRSCQQDPSYVHRGNLDPEIAALIKKYGLNKEEDDLGY